MVKTAVHSIACFESWVFRARWDAGEDSHHNQAAQCPELKCRSWWGHKETIRTCGLSCGGAALSSWRRSALSSHSVCSGLWPPSASCCSTPSAPTPRLGTHTHTSDQHREPHTATRQNNEPSHSPNWFLSCGSLLPKVSTTFFKFSVSIHTHTKTKKKELVWIQLLSDENENYSYKSRKSGCGVKENKHNRQKSEQTVSSTLGSFTHFCTQTPWRSKEPKQKNNPAVKNSFLHSFQLPPFSLFIHFHTIEMSHATLQLLFTLRCFGKQLLLRENQRKRHKKQAGSLVLFQVLE